MAGKKGRAAVCYGAEKYQWPAKTGRKREGRSKWTSKQAGEVIMEKHTRCHLRCIKQHSQSLGRNNIFGSFHTCAVHDKKRSHTLLNEDTLWKGIHDIGRGSREGK
jgi:hypothetical protein